MSENLYNVCILVGRLLVVVPACFVRSGQTVDRTVFLASMTCHLPQREIAECLGLSGRCRHNQVDEDDRCTRKHA
jgi:hypothetical protein